MNDNGMHATTIEEVSGTIGIGSDTPRWWQKGLGKLRLLLCIVYLGATQCVMGTTVGVEIVQCPACDRHYVSNVIMSWNSMTSPNGPPEQTGICPWCLFAWSNKPPQRLTAEERTRVYGAISAAPSHPSESVRNKLIHALEDGKSTGVEAYLRRVCDTARQGNQGSSQLPRFTWNTPKTDSSERKKERALTALLPKMIEAKRVGQPGPLPAEFGNREMSALFTNENLIHKGHIPAAEYFLRWAVAADEKTVKECDYAVTLNLQAMGSIPGSQWPAVDYANARVPLMSDCLRYIQTASPMPESVARRISARSWDEFSNIALGACTARRDSAAVALLSKRLARSRDPLPGDAVVAYYKKVGVPADVPVLQQYAQRLYRDSSQDSMDWLGMVRGDVEEAILTTNLRALFAGTPSGR
ncbi:hypothetical protein ACXR0O_12735 [Verrucomicrobiota bacterium sgz303538]